MAGKRYSSGSGNGGARWQNEKVNDAYDRYAELMIEKIRHFTGGDYKKQWFTEGEALWPKSLYGKDYHGTNAMMLMFVTMKEHYSSPFWATSARIHNLNFIESSDGSKVAATNDNGDPLPFVHVKKGEHSFPVILTKTNVKHIETGESISIHDYMDMDTSQRENYYVYSVRRVYPVFNIDQTNLSEVRPEYFEKLHEGLKPQKITDDFRFPEVDRMIDNNLWVCPIELKYQDKCCYRLRDDSILMPEREQFESSHSFYKTLFHEMIHSTGAENRLNRFNNDGDKMFNYGREELVAELGAAMTAHHYGLESNIKDDSISYLKGWLNGIKEDPSFLRTVLSDVRLAVPYLTTRIDDVLNIEKKESLKEDLRDADGVIIDIDEDGDMNIVENDLGADKKQGEDEKKERTFRMGR